MKRISAIATAVTILFFSSCNDSSTDKEKEDVTTKDTLTAMPPTPAPPAIEPVFTPFKTVVVMHKVKDFAKWREAYMGHDSVRQLYGVSHYRLARGIEDSNMVMVVDKMADVKKAEEFGNSAALKDAMQKAGVMGKPRIVMNEVIRNDDSHPEYKDRVTTIHKVKDFATWLKVYDSVGKAKRAEHGLMDKSLSRNLDDSNLVRVTFIVTDMVKAKARLASDDVKKVMKDGGVEGKTEVFWYRVVE